MTVATCTVMVTRALNTQKTSSAHYKTYFASPSHAVSHRYCRPWSGCEIEASRNRSGARTDCKFRKKLQLHTTMMQRIYTERPNCNYLLKDASLPETERSNEPETFSASVQENANGVVIIVAISVVLLCTEPRTSFRLADEEVIISCTLSSTGV